MFQVKSKGFIAFFCPQQCKFHLVMSGRLLFMYMLCGLQYTCNTCIYDNVIHPCILTEDPVVRARLCEALEAVLNRAQEPNKSKKIQHSNAKNAVLFEAVNLILHFQG